MGSMVELDSSQGLDCKDRSLTKQSFKDECDINNILKNYMKTGNWVNAQGESGRKPLVGDFSSVPDYQEAMNLVLKAQADFASLDATIRDRFSNSPERFLDFMNNPDNYDEAVRLKILEPKKKAPEILPGAQDVSKGDSVASKGTK